MGRTWAWLCVCSSQAVGVTAEQCSIVGHKIVQAANAGRERHKVGQLLWRGPVEVRLHSSHKLCVGDVDPRLLAGLPGRDLLQARLSLLDMTAWDV
jgi:hypothetical protein